MAKRLPKITVEEAADFRADLIEVCERHGLCIAPWFVEYDEYDSDSGLEILRGPDVWIRDAICYGRK